MNYKYTKKLNFKNIWSVVLLLILVVSIFGISLYSVKQYFSLTSQADNPYVGLTFNPDQQTTNSNTPLSTSLILIPNGFEVTGLELNLNYDPQVVEVISFTPTSALPTILSPVRIANGEVSVTLGCAISAPLKNSTIIGTLNYRLLKSVKTNITVSSKTFVTAINKDVNVLGEYPSFVISTPTPQPSSTTQPTPTPTPVPTHTPTPQPSSNNTPTPQPTPSPTPTLKPPTFSRTTLPSATVDRSYSASVNVTGHNNKSLSFTTTNLPSWMSMTCRKNFFRKYVYTCQFRGTPRQSGISNFTLNAIDSAGTTASQTYNIVVN